MPHARRLRENLLHRLVADTVKEQTAQFLIGHFMQIIDNKGTQISLRTFETQPFRLILNDFEIVCSKSLAHRGQVILDGRQSNVHLISKAHLCDRGVR